MSITAATAGSRPHAGVGARDRMFYSGMALAMAITVFAGFVGAALWKRRDREAHKRLMMLAYISIIVAAVARLPGVLAFGPPAFFGLTCILLFASMAYDYVSRRRVHPVYLWGGALFIVSVPVRLMLSTTEAWLGLARVLTQ
jgi:hypothetical protein